MKKDFNQRKQSSQDMQNKTHPDVALDVHTSLHVNSTLQVAWEI
jgi:hypothetical protein